MNKEIQEKSQTLHDWILEQEVVKEFQRYEVLIENHQELKELEEELKDLQKQIVRVKHENIDAHDLVETYQKKKQLYDENPLIYNYSLLKQEVNILFQEITSEINMKLSKKG